MNFILGILNVHFYLSNQKNGEKNIVITQSYHLSAKPPKVRIVNFHNRIFRKMLYHMSSCHLEKCMLML